MLSRLKFLLFVPLFVLSGFGVRAQDIDYLKHGKIFCLCSFKLECSYCKDCNNERYVVKISNDVDKKITNVWYKYYSEPLNTFIEKEAKLDIGQVDNLGTGSLHICVPNGRQWIISKIQYADGSANTFILHNRMGDFRQDADECDCND